MRNLNKNKLIFTLCLAVLLFVPKFSFADEFSDYENSILKEIYQKRADARKLSSYEEMEKFLKAYQISILNSEDQSKISSEARLTFENLLILERWQCLWEIDSKMTGLKEMIYAQYEKNIAWNEKHPFEKQNPWLKLSSFDLINSTMQYLSQGKLIKLGLQEKKVYDDLVEKFPNMSMALLLSGHWYYNAPGIGGGSKNKARKLYARALQNATNDYEKFFTNIYLAQLTFEQDKGGMNNKLYQQYMDGAENAIPNTFYIKFIRDLNSAGVTLYEYALDPVKIKKKVFGK